RGRVTVCSRPPPPVRGVAPALGGALRCPGGRRRCRGDRQRRRRGHAWVVGGTGRGARLRGRHLLAQLQDVPRRTALPRAVGLRTRRRGPHERELSMSTLAPHLVRPLKFLFPLTRRLWERPYMAAGFVLYDVMGGAKSVPPQKHYTRAGALRVAPGLREDAVIGGIRYWDTLVDDARHTLTLARTAAKHGAVVANSTQ